MRIYIDSRHRTADSASDADFSILLRRPLEFPPNSVAVIEQCVLSNVFESIIENVNDKIYARESISGVITDKVLKLGAGSYTPASLATVIGTALNTLNGTYTCTVASTGNKLVITNTYTFPDHAEILTRTQLVDQSLSPAWTGTGTDILQYNDPQDACAVLGIMAGTGGVHSAQMLLTRFISLQPYRCLYLHSHLGAAASSLGPQGQDTIIRCIITGNTVPGDVITDIRHGTGTEVIKMPASLSNMHFSLRDSNNKIVDLQGHPLILTLVVQEAQ